MSAAESGDGLLSVHQTAGVDGATGGGTGLLVVHRITTVSGGAVSVEAVERRIALHLRHLEERNACFLKLILYLESSS